MMNTYHQNSPSKYFFSYYLERNAVKIKYTLPYAALIELIHCSINIEASTSGFKSGDGTPKSYQAVKSM